MSKFEYHRASRKLPVRATTRWDGWNDLLAPQEALTAGDVKDCFFTSKGARLRTFGR